MQQVLLLLSYGADVNAMTDARNDYRTVLHYAVLSGTFSNWNSIITNVKPQIPLILCTRIGKLDIF